MVNWHPLGTIWHPLEGPGTQNLFIGGYVGLAKLPRCHQYQEIPITPGPDTHLGAPIVFHVPLSWAAPRFNRYCAMLDLLVSMSQDDLQSILHQRVRLLWYHCLLVLLHLFWIRSLIYRFWHLSDSSTFRFQWLRLSMRSCIWICPTTRLASFGVWCSFLRLSRFEYSGWMSDLKIWATRMNRF